MIILKPRGLDFSCMIQLSKLICKPSVWCNWNFLLGSRQKKGRFYGIPPRLRKVSFQEFPDFDSMYPSLVRHTFGFPFCQRLWDLKKRQDDIVLADMVDDIVANIEIHKLADIVADMKADKKNGWHWFGHGGRHGGRQGADLGGSIWPPKKLIFFWVSECSFQEKVKELFPLGGEWGFTYSHILFFWTKSENFCWEQKWF